MPRATGSLDVEFSDTPYDERDDTRLARRRLAKVFKGDIRGESTGEFLLAMGSHGSAAYVGLDRVTATIDGRAGTFILVHSAMRTPADESASIKVLPGSATGDLVGLRGALTIAVDADGVHSYTFDYDIAES